MFVWFVVALRKESVDRNCGVSLNYKEVLLSLSARRAWIEIVRIVFALPVNGVALRKESVDRNNQLTRPTWKNQCRSPQGERG